MADLLEVGRIAKAHGIAGEVVVSLWSELTERLAPGSRLVTDDGELVVRSSKPFKHQYLVRFEGIGDRNAAEALSGTLLRAEPVERDGVLWIHELIGCEVELLDGTRVGVVEAVEANPASDLLVLDGAHLVPLTFLVRHDAGRLVVIDPPEGLFD